MIMSIDEGTLLWSAESVVLGEHDDDHGDCQCK